MQSHGNHNDSAEQNKLYRYWRTPYGKLSVRLSVCDVGGLWWHALEFVGNNTTDTLITDLALGSPNVIDMLQREHPKF